ncbi:MAG: DUF790 family protein [Magnetococcales bacterium]|nr:DUF790 family protein [Magnetococcales bacterium]
MLTRELLRYDRREGRLIPRFVDTTTLILQNLVRDLSLVYAAGEGQSREELADAVLPLINSYRSPMIAKGVNKLLLDRCTFRESLEGLEEQRMAIFTTAAKHLRADDRDDLELFRRAVVRDMGRDDPDQLALDLHADLPVRQPLMAFDSIEPEDLLHRYNMALAQGPLIWSHAMTLYIWESDIGKRRQFFRHLKFFQLLATIVPTSEKGLRLDLDGPLSLFDVTRKYGIKLANFLPAVCALSRWKVTAMTRIRNEPAATLELDETSGLKSHYTRTTAYVPDEFTTFAAKFKEEVADWKILTTSPLVELGGQEMAIPDFSFRHKNGITVHLELFHAWHEGHLPRRLARLDGSHKPVFLAVGVDRALSKQPALSKLLENSRWFQDHGFVFNQFPPVKRVEKCLDGFLGVEME